MSQSGQIPTNIQKLDLEQAKRALISKLALPEVFIDDILIEYLRAWTLKLLNPGHDIITSHYIDELRHQHILDTKQYREDCENILGYFWEHIPYREESAGGTEITPMTIAMNETRKLYAEYFGKSPRKDIWGEKPPCL